MSLGIPIPIEANQLRAHFPDWWQSSPVVRILIVFNCLEINQSVTLLSTLIWYWSKEVCLTNISCECDYCDKLKEADSIYSPRISENASHIVTVSQCLYTESTNLQYKPTERKSSITLIHLYNYGDHVSSLLYERPAGPSTELWLQHSSSW